VNWAGPEDAAHDSRARPARPSRPRARSDERAPLVIETKAGEETVDGKLAAGDSSGETKDTGTFASSMRT
jgi:hypothetical protein